MMIRINATPLSDFLNGVRITKPLDLSGGGLVETDLDGVTLWVFPSAKLRAMVEAAK